jgi:hypothetical protein
MFKRITPEPPPPTATIRFKTPRRISEWCAFSGTSRATTWRRIKDRTLLVEYFGSIPYIVGGPAHLSRDNDDKVA